MDQHITPSLWRDDPSLLTDGLSLLTDDPSLLTDDPSLLTDDPSLLADDPSFLDCRHCLTDATTEPPLSQVSHGYWTLDTLPQ